MIKVSSSVASLALTGSRLAIGFNCGAVEVLIPHNDYDDHDVMVSLGNYWFIISIPKVLDANRGELLARLEKPDGLQGSGCRLQFGHKYFLTRFSFFVLLNQTNPLKLFDNLFWWILTQGGFWDDRGRQRGWWASRMAQWGRSDIKPFSFSCFLSFLFLEVGTWWFKDSTVWPLSKHLDDKFWSSFMLHDELFYRVPLLIIIYSTIQADWPTTGTHGIAKTLERKWESEGCVLFI